MSIPKMAIFKAEKVTGFSKATIILGPKNAASFRGFSFRDPRIAWFIFDNPNNLGESPNNLGESPSNLGESPSNLGESPNNLGESPNHLGESPNHLGESPNKLGESPNHLGDQWVVSHPNSSPIYK